MSPPFTVRDLGEIVLRVRTLDPMLAFYRDIIGLELLPHREARRVFFRIGSGHANHTKVLALFETQAPDDLTPGARTALHHLALNIDWAEQIDAVAWYRGHGLDVTIREFAGTGARGIVVRDPEGNSVELVAQNPDRGDLGADND